jgi:hypothetical protein
MAEQGTSPSDPFAEFDLSCEFPFAVEAYAELRSYVRVVNEFISHSSAQQAVRIQSRLKREDDPVRLAELQFELETVKRDEAVVLPRIVWGGILVSIFAAYEHGVRSALRHWQRAAGHPIKFQCLPRKDFLRSAEQYAKESVGVLLFDNDRVGETIKELKSFRNSFAHGSGLLSDLPEKLVASIKEQRHPGVALQTIEGQWSANASSAAYYLVHSERTIQQFENGVLEKCLVHHRLQLRPT